MIFKSAIVRLCAVAAAILLSGTTVHTYAAPYIVGGATQAVISDSGGWAWDGAFLTDFRAALENPAYFGPGGIVNRQVSTVNLNAVNAGTLAGVNMFVGTWITDGQAAPIQNAIVDFFFNGGDLFLLQDDSGHDGVGTALGLSTTPSTGSDSNGGAPLFNGPFGIANNVHQFYLVGQLDGAAIAAHNGHVGGTNADGQITSAFWAAGEYAPGTGSLFVIADIDMIATTAACGSPPCGGTYAPLNDNGIYALNTFAFLQQNTGSAPEPGPLSLLGIGLVGVALVRRRK